VGFALAAYPVGVERGWFSRISALKRTLAALRFFWNSPQATGPDMTGHMGFYYHFLDMTNWRRAGNCELSTVDTGFLLALMLDAAPYFDQDSKNEREIRTLADALLPAVGLAEGVRRRRDDHPRVDSRARISAVPLERL